MSDTVRVDLSLDEGQATFSLMAERLDALAKAWSAGGLAPDIAALAPPGPRALRRLVLVELIKLDLKFRWPRRLERRVEDYVAEFPELATAVGLPADLIFAEYQARRAAGEDVSVSEFVNRFPAQSAELSRLLNPQMCEQSTIMGGPKPHDLQPGEQLDDFDLVATLGDGAFARVFLARQRSMERFVALKVSANRGDEPRTLAQLDHPHIVRVYDQRVLPERGLRLLYMPYLPGGTLQDVLRLVRKTPRESRTGAMLLQAVDLALERRGEVPPVDSPTRHKLAAMSWPDAVCWLGSRLAEALESAHHLRVLHRDIKPANVLLGADCAPRLADFNVSVCTKLEGASPSAFFGGSVGYMSPEQIEAFHPSHERLPDDLDGRADIYSLAVTLWELLTGLRPFPDEGVDASWSETLEAMLARRTAGLPSESLKAIPTDAPPGLREILLRALEGNRELRFPTASEFARQLDLCLRPNTRALLIPSPGWRTWARRHPLLAIYPLALIPNIIASELSILYNGSAIVSKYPATKPVFEFLQIAVNGSFFPIGILLFAILILPVARGLRRARLENLSSAERAEFRRKTLRLGLGSVVVVLWAWIAAGVIFPVTLNLKVGDLPAEAFWHFLTSQTLCGLIAVSYPLFAITFVAVRALYPAFCSGNALPAADVKLLAWVEKSLGWSLVVAASVPMVALGLLAQGDSRNRLAMSILSVVGIAAVAVAYFLTTAVRADIAALTDSGTRTE